MPDIFGSKISKQPTTFSYVFLATNSRLELHPSSTQSSICTRSMELSPMIASYNPPLYVSLLLVLRGLGDTVSTMPSLDMTTCLVLFIQKELV